LALQKLNQKVAKEDTQAIDESKEILQKIGSKMQGKLKDFFAQNLKKAELP
jgi:Holliday junction resolvasome RuvABC DNA-binding subunit